MQKNIATACPPPTQWFNSKGFKGHYTRNPLEQFS